MSENSVFEKISHFVDKVVGFFAMLSGMVMTVTTLLGILFRYVMSNPLPWTEELARYTMIWMGLLAISMGVRRDEHLGLRLVINLFPESIKRVIKYLTRIIIGVFLYYLMVYGFQMALNGLNQIAPALRIQMFYVLVAVPISAFLALLQMVLITINDVYRWTKGYKMRTTPSEGREV